MTDKKDDDKPLFATSYLIPKEYLDKVLILLKKSDPGGQQQQQQQPDKPKIIAPKGDKELAARKKDIEEQKDLFFKGLIELFPVNIQHQVYKFLSQWAKRELNNFDIDTKTLEIFIDGKKLFKSNIVDILLFFYDIGTTYETARDSSKSYEIQIPRSALKLLIYLLAKFKTKDELIKRFFFDEARIDYILSSVYFDKPNKGQKRKIEKSFLEEKSSYPLPAKQSTPQINNGQNSKNLNSPFVRFKPFTSRQQPDTSQKLSVLKLDDSVEEDGASWNEPWVTPKDVVKPSSFQNQEVNKPTVPLPQSPMLVDQPEDQKKDIASATTPPPPPPPPPPARALSRELKNLQPSPTGSFAQQLDDFEKQRKKKESVRYTRQTSKKKAI